MAKSKIGLVKSNYIEGAPKKTRQGRSKNTHLGATARNGRKKRYRGQGNWLNSFRRDSNPVKSSV